MKNKKSPGMATTQQTDWSILFSEIRLTESQALDIKGGRGPSIEPDVP